ncbi:MAG: 1-deoxy-D-xylulose-5-phosphate synthase [Coriobacteriales bacterium]|jgi:1-deoxy-D-xylulose-5-phosphate synthase|nr:1-deoxy-D-xylulose-5-phosphate synthase [Coriobacteriales bacterium]
MAEGFLQNILSPEHLRGLTLDDLECLAAEIRARLIEVTAKNGGHLAASLGTVEVTLALHLLYDFSCDRLVFDVGHQAYAHKILTGRNDAFESLRSYDGVCGFPRRDESVYDAHDAGHASDSLSIAVGLALARDLRGSDERVVALIGDAALSGGMAFEALNQIGHERSDLTIVLNDNEMSISRSVGAMSLYLAKLRVSRPYVTARDALEGGLSRAGQPGRALVRAGELAKSSFKKLVVPGMFFEDMGIRYIGPIDGHNIAALLRAFKIARSAAGPVLVHTVTRKGRGFEPAERQPDVFHGVGRFDPQTGALQKEQAETESYTTLFSKALIAEATTDADIVAVTAAMEEGTGLAAFRRTFPARFFDVGIAEEHAVALAAGLALGGKKPVVAIYSTFLQRAFDQLMIDVAQQSQHVVFAVDRAGLVGEDGPTHHGAFDLAYLRSVPGMRVLAPAAADDIADCLHTALALGDGPVALRYPRGTAPTNASLERPPELLPMGVARRLRDGRDVAILAVGRFVSVALEAAALLEQCGIEALVYNMLWVKPLDENAVAAACATGLVVTVEDGVVNGGFGSAVLEAVAGHPEWFGAAGGAAGAGDVAVREAAATGDIATTGAAASGDAAAAGVVGAVATGDVVSGAAAEAAIGTGDGRLRILRLGLPDAFVPHGATKTLFAELGLSADQIAERIAGELGRQLESRKTAS